MGRYETFVVRLWVEGAQAINHGEVRRLPDGLPHRFRSLDEVTDYIEQDMARAGGTDGGDRSDKPIRAVDWEDESAAEETL